MRRRQQQGERALPHRFAADQVERLAIGRERASTRRCRCGKRPCGRCPRGRGRSRGTDAPDHSAACRRARPAAGTAPAGRRGCGCRPARAVLRRRRVCRAGGPGPSRLRASRRAAGSAGCGRQERRRAPGRRVRRADSRCRRAGRRRNGNRALRCLLRPGGERLIFGFLPPEEFKRRIPERLNLDRIAFARSSGRKIRIHPGEVRRLKIRPDSSSMTMPFGVPAR